MREQLYVWVCRYAFSFVEPDRICATSLEDALALVREKNNDPIESLTFVRVARDKEQRGIL